MASTTSYRNIEPLTKSNYDTWCLQAQAVLIKNDYWDIVSGEKTLSPTADAVETGFKPSKADPCVYTLEKGGDKIVIAIWVDDLLIAYSNLKQLQEVKKALMSKFELKDLGQPKRMIGIDFTYEGNHIKLIQVKYINDMLKRFNMQDCKPTATPIEPGLKLEMNKETRADIPYKNLIGSLMYLAVATRPDIMFAVSYLSQFNDAYNEEHFKCAKRVLRYAKGTIDLGLYFKKTGKLLYGLADADWGACKIDRRSFSGYCFIYAGASITWASRKQKCVALSTAEAEYVAITEAAKEAIHLKSLYADLGQKDLKTVEIANDNQAAIKLSQNPMVTSKSKHIDLKIHFIRDCTQQGTISLNYLDTKSMAADLLTKGLAGPRLAQLRTTIGVI